MFYLIAYDITQAKRLTKVAELCKDYGFQRVQKSVFAGEADSTLLQSFLTSVKGIIVPDSDSIIIIPVCGTCQKSQISLGIAKDMQEYHDKYFIMIQ